MRRIETESLKEKIYSLCIKANVELSEDVLSALKNAKEEEEGAARDALEQILENARIAKEKAIPICQDTGMVIVFFGIGENTFFEGSFHEAVQEGVREAYKEFRPSMVHDPISRKNTENNTPALVYTYTRKGEGLDIHVFLKGAGAENQSRTKFFLPTESLERIEDFIVHEAVEASYFSCPPCIIGVGIGGDHIKASFLAKMALLREVGKPNPDPFYAQMEARLLARINSSGVGPAALGGKTTALDVKIETFPTHIGSLPVVINVCCHAKRVARARM
jgi:fumarate hydratase subunit alpha